MSKRVGRVVAVLVLVMLSSGAIAQPLVERVPAGVDTYIGWKGADALRGQYEGSHLQGVVNASQLARVFEQTWPKVIERVAQEDPPSAEALKDAGEVLRLSWRYPTAVFVASTDDPSPRAGIIVQAGAQADALAEQFRKIVAGRSATAKVFRLDDLAVVAIGYPQEQMALAGAGENRPQPITTDAKFNTAMAQVQKDAAVVYYSNLGAAAQRLQAELSRSAPTSQPAAGGMPREAMSAVVRLTGSLDTMAWTGAFDGKQWRTRMFIGSESPRKGLATLLEAQPLSEDVLKAIPKDADWVVVRRLDLNKVHSEARAVAEAIGPEALKGFDQVMGASTVALGTNLQQNLFDPLGDEWAIYIAPRSVGAGFMGAVAINRVDDPAKVNRALSSIAIATSNVFTNAMRRQKMGLQLRTHDHKGTRISYLPTPFITPAWAIKGKLLYVGLYPQTVAAALDAGGSGGSLVDSEAFQAVRKQLPDKPVTSVSFVDLPATASQSYATLLMLAQSYMGFADLFGAEGQPMLLPTLNDLRPHLTASGRVAWVDEAGWHAETIGPFPLSDVLAGEFSAVASQYPVLMGILVPSLMRAREAAEDVQSLSNLRQIGTAIHMYAADNKGQLPPDLGALVKGNYLAPQSAATVFRAPSQRLAAEAAPMTADEAAEWVNRNSSYLYVRPAERLVDVRNGSGVIMAYENPANAGPGDKLAAVFVDGHAESLTPERLNEILAQQGAKE